MKKKLDKLKKLFEVNKAVIVFLFVIALIGITVGSILCIALNKSDASLVSEVLNNFLNNIKNNDLDYLASFLNSFLANLGFVLTIWFLGISLIGLPLTILLFFLKNFILGFSIASIIANYKLKGILLALFNVFPHTIINIFVLMVLTMYSLSLSLKIGSTVLKRNTLDFKPIMHKYIKVLFLAIIVSIITSLIETFFAPQLIKLVITIL
jgi:stage II sporulation protein M